MEMVIRLRDAGARLAALAVVALAVCSARLGSAQSPATNDTAEVIGQAQRAINQGKPDQAVEDLQRVAAAHPDAEGVERELGLAFYRMGKLEEARNAFDAALRQDKDDLESVQMMGFVLYRMGRQDAAILYLERVRSWMPNANADANYILALSYMNAHRYNEARTAFALQYNLAPDSAEAYLLTATMLRIAKNPDAAAEQAQKALQISPTLSRAHLLLGDLAMLRSDFAEALKQFTQEARINATEPLVYDRLGDAYLQSGNLVEAQKALIRSLALDRTNTECFVKMGRVLLAKQDVQSAVMYLRIAEKMDPGHFVTHDLLAQAYHRMGLNEDAKREAELARQTHNSGQSAN